MTSARLMTAVVRPGPPRRRQSRTESHLINPLLTSPTSARNLGPVLWFGHMAAHRILIVEDEQDIAGLIKHTLERSGEAEAEVVGSGDAALKAVADRPPDLIILDLNLPVLSGIEVCRILRSRADAKHLPIIMLTARTSEDDRVSGLELGADDYVTKPFSLRELAARVRAVLRRSTTLEERPPAGYQGAHLNADFDAVAVAVDGGS